MPLDIAIISIMISYAFYLLMGAALGMFYIEHFYGRCRELLGDKNFPCMIRSIIAWPVKFPFGVRK